jgi:hypothetical protein
LNWGCVLTEKLKSVVPNFFQLTEQNLGEIAHFLEVKMSKLKKIALG